MKELNVLSLFDGCSCGQESLKQLNIPVGKYYASEIDKYAIAVTQHNHPETIQLGDITEWKTWNIDWSEIDLMFGGSPCQGFSLAGKQLAFDDPRSQLFFVFVDIKNHINKERAKKDKNSCKFLLENVRMKKEYLDIISDYMAVQPVMINSALVSAQNRVRYYWTNIADLEQPEDRGILLKDILDEGEVDREKSHCLDANYAKGANYEQYKKKSRRQLKCVQVAFGCAMRGRYNEEGKTTQRIEENGKEKANSITTVQKDSMVRIMQTPRGNNKGGEKALDGKTPTLTSNAWEQNNKLIQGKDWRKLTPIECERLQTMPDNYTLVPWQKRMMSNSQRYKMLGNGWTIEVIKHIFKNLK